MTSMTQSQKPHMRSLHAGLIAGSFGEAKRNDGWGG